MQEKVTPTFERLNSIIDSRRRITHDLRQLRLAKTITWFAPASGLVESTEFVSTLTTLDAYKEQLEDNEASQKSIFEDLKVRMHLPLPSPLRSNSKARTCVDGSRRCSSDSGVSARPSRTRRVCSWHVPGTQRVRSSASALCAH